MKLAKTVVPQLGVLASVLGLSATLYSVQGKLTELSVAITAIGLIAVFASALVEIADYRRDKPCLFSSDEAVQRYMYNWIRNGSRTAIFTRNLSWVDEEGEKLLREKAAGSDLTLIAPGMFPLAEELRAAGADVVYYPSLKYTLQTRFTFINVGKTGERVAIGHATGRGKHRIDEYSAASENPAFFLAKDMMEVLQRSRRK